jgi:hypothetical protein
MLASKEFDHFVESVTDIPHQLALRLRANAVSAEGRASTFRAHFNIFDGGLPRLGCSSPPRGRDGAQARCAC